MKALALLSFCTVLAFAAAPAAAQQNVGINLFRGSATLSGVLCGFDCNSATNTGQATANVNDNIGVRLLGQDQLPAVLLIGAGQSWPCPGFAIPGFGNALLVDPATLLVAGSTPNLTGQARGSCGETANQILFQLTLPPLRPGTLVHFQGVVFDAGNPAFTRPIELTIQ
jgi:hypothetical protein